MNTENDLHFNAALRAALDELLSEDVREVEESVYKKKKRRIRYLIAAAAVLIMTAIPVIAYTGGYSLIKHKDYNEISVSSDKKHSDRIDSFVIGYLPDGWTQKTIRDSDEIKRIAISSDSSEIIISKSVYDSNNIIYIDDHFGEPEIITHDGIEYYYFKNDIYSILIFVDDFYYLLDAENTERDELLKIAYNLD